MGDTAKKKLTGLSGVAGNAFVQSVKLDLGKNKVFDICGRNKPAVEVAADIFRHLIEDAQVNYNVTPAEGIVTVPLYFDGRARRDLRKAANEAGFYIKSFLHEPFAALIGHVCRKEGRESIKKMEGMHVLVFDWGGGTLDITVGRIDQDQILELGIAGLPSKAGNHFTDLLANTVRRQFFAQHGMMADTADITPATRDRYLAETDRCKIALSAIDGRMNHMQLANFCEYEKKNYDLDTEVSREQFEDEIRATVDEAMRKVDAALESARLTARQIDLCLMVGGTSLIPMVQSRMRDRFGHTLNTVEDADSLIAEGAAIADAYDMRPAFADTVAMEMSDGTYHSLFGRGHPAIAEHCQKALRLFCTDNRDGQARIIVGLHDPDSDHFDRKVIAVAGVSDSLPKPFDHERIDVNIKVDDNLVLLIDAKGATQPVENSVRAEVVDLRYSVSLAGL